MIPETHNPYTFSQVEPPVYDFECLEVGFSRRVAFASRGGSREVSEPFFADGEHLNVSVSLLFEPVRSDRIGLADIYPRLLYPTRFGFLALLDQPNMKLFKEHVASCNFSSPCSASR